LPWAAHKSEVWCLATSLTLGRYHFAGEIALLAGGLLSAFSAGWLEFL
jgi:hypothetical protein